MEKYCYSIKLLIAFTLIGINLQKAASQTYQVGSGLSAPDGLMCDLLTYTDYRSLNGYPALGELQNAANVQSVQILNRRPTFSWVINDKRSGILQVAFQLLISDDLEKIQRDSGNIWDSGKVRSSKSAGVIYEGGPLLPDHQYYWKVRVWNNSNDSSVYSKPAKFRTGMQLAGYYTETYPIEKTDQLPLTIAMHSGITRVDFGKDAFGQLKLSLSTEKPNDTVVLRLGELLNPDGSINRKPGGTIRFAEYILPLMPGLHTYQVSIRPDKRNTGRNAIKMPDYIGEVMPFRYCEIEGIKQTIKPEQVVRAMVSYPFDDSAAKFNSSDTLLNQIWDLCKYTIKATSFAGIYVDGDRERIPYEADAYINQLSHYVVDREYSIARRSHEYLISHANWPTEWIMQSVLMAWNDYLYTGDLSSARFYYEDLKAKTLMPLEDTNGLITVRKTTPELLRQIHLISKKEPYGLMDIVDWPHSGILGLNGGEGGETDGFVFTEYNAVVNAFYYRALVIMRQLARDLGRKKDAEMFKAKALRFRKIYKSHFYDPKQGIYCDGATTRHASLHSNVFALALGLVDDKDKGKILSFIKSRGMACSVYGSQFLLDAVYDGGDGNYGLSLLTSKTQRSWYNMIKVGSTMTLEAWDNKFKPNQDWNHAWGAAPANIISRKLMGIEPLEPGWSEFIIAPKPADLLHAAISVPTIKGTVSMDFQNGEFAFKMNANIPANTVAQVYLPFDERAFSKVLVNGVPVKATKTNKGLYIRDVGSGTHHFEVLY